MQRYDFKGLLVPGSSGPKESVDGAWIKHSDYERVVVELKEELREARLESEVFVAETRSDFEKMEQAINERYRGKTLSREEADELIHMINRCVPPPAEQLREQLAAANRKIKRLVAPVSDGDCRAFENSYGEKLMLNYVDYGLSEFIAARLEPQK